MFDGDKITLQAAGKFNKENVEWLLHMSGLQRIENLEKMAAARRRRIFISNKIWAFADKRDGCDLTGFELQLTRELERPSTVERY